VEISRLSSCPKCKGFLMREKDRYGLYEQCMQCGYIHDLQTVGWVDKLQAEEQKDEEDAQCVSAESSNDEPQNTPQLTEYSHIEDLTVPPNVQLILNYLLKERQNNPH
jgi:DNA-directed RNA polymerase subunit M/transcription elongation factor TFIIS